MAAFRSWRLSAKSGSDSTRPRCRYGAGSGEAVFIMDRMNDRRAATEDLVEEVLRTYVKMVLYARVGTVRGRPAPSSRALRSRCAMNVQRSA
jgi:hypothetical protein